MTAIIGLIGVLIGAAISLYGNYIQFKNNKKLQEQQIIQQKLEEICQIAEGIYISNKQLNFECYGYMRLGQPIIASNIKDTSFSASFSHLNMLINFYAPKLYAPQLKEISQLLREGVRLHNNAMGQMYDSKDPQDKENAFKYALKANQLIDNLCKEIINLSANIVRDDFLK